MVTREDIQRYRGAFLSRGADFLYVQPDASLRPYISCYTITFPSGMPDAYTIFPSASSTIIVSVGSGGISSALRGVNTTVSNVGGHANKMQCLLLVEFHSGCLLPFVGIDQFELVDAAYALSDIDARLTAALEEALLACDSAEALISSVDGIFLRRLADIREAGAVAAIKRAILARNGNIGMAELSSAFYYSEKHMRRLFLRHIGTGPKSFSRIVRVNYALRLLRGENMRFADAAAHAGFFDQPHFVHDFKSVCGLTPQEYMRNMSVFYNDEYKF